MIEAPHEALNIQEVEARAAELYATLIEKPEVKEAFTLLDKLPGHLRYHAKEHTTEDVVKETILFALADGASSDVVERQVIAAAWHDVGYIIQDKMNEPEAIKLFMASEAAKSLPEHVRDEIVANIADTAVMMDKGTPKLLQKASEYGYVLDADVSNFGREDFFEKGALLMEELKIDTTNPAVVKGFLNFTLNLLKNHEWKTASARALREDQKQKNIAELEAKIAALG